MFICLPDDMSSLRGDVTIEFLDARCYFPWIFTETNDRC